MGSELIPLLGRQIIPLCFALRFSQLEDNMKREIWKNPFNEAFFADVVVLQFTLLSQIPCLLNFAWQSDSWSVGLIVPAHRIQSSVGSLLVP